jgi:hypothetical protein
MNQILMTPKERRKHRRELVFGYFLKQIIFVSLFLGFSWIIQYFSDCSFDRAMIITLLLDYLTRVVVRKNQC